MAFLNKYWLILYKKSIWFSWAWGKFELLLNSRMSKLVIARHCIFSLIVTYFGIFEAIFDSSGAYNLVTLMKFYTLMDTKFAASRRFYCCFEIPDTLKRKACAISAQFHQWYVGSTPMLTLLLTFFEQILHKFWAFFKRWSRWKHLITVSKKGFCSRVKIILE